MKAASLTRFLLLMSCLFFTTACSNMTLEERERMKLMEQIDPSLLQLNISEAESIQDDLIHIGVIVRRNADSSVLVATNTEKWLPNEFLSAALEGGTLPPLNLSYSRALALPSKRIDSIFLHPTIGCCLLKMSGISDELRPGEISDTSPNAEEVVYTFEHRGPVVTCTFDYLVDTARIRTLEGERAIREIKFGASNDKCQVGEIVVNKDGQLLAINIFDPGDSNNESVGVLLADVLKEFDNGYFIEVSLR